jgi:hypothetical protein
MGKEQVPDSIKTAKVEAASRRFEVESSNKESLMPARGHSCSQKSDE